MTYTEKFFKFPYKMYTRKDWEIVHEQEDEAKLANSTSDIKEPPYSIGTQVIEVDQIIGYSTAFSYGRSIEDVNEKGPDLTYVDLKNGKELPCLWPIDEFEKKLNEHKEFLSFEEEKEMIKEAEERSKKIREILEQNLSEIKKQYEENNIPLNLE